MKNVSPQSMPPTRPKLGTAVGMMELAKSVLIVALPPMPTVSIINLEHVIPIFAKAYAFGMSGALGVRVIPSVRPVSKFEDVLGLMPVLIRQLKPKHVPMNFPVFRHLAL